MGSILGTMSSEQLRRSVVMNVSESCYFLNFNVLLETNKNILKGKETMNYTVLCIIKCYRKCCKNGKKATVLRLFNINYVQLTRRS